MDLKQLKKDLPIGALNEISRLSGVNRSTVQKFFEGRKTKVNILLLQTTTNYLTEYKAKENQAIEKLQAVASA